MIERFMGKVKDEKEKEEELRTTGAGAYLGSRIGKRLADRDVDDYLANLTPEERAKEIEAMNKSRVAKI